MRKSMLWAVAMIAVASPVLVHPAMAQMGGGGMGGMGGGGGMGGMGGGAPVEDSGGEDSTRARNIGESDNRPAMKPLSQEQFDKAVAAMFALADTNRDGMVTLAELQAVVEARRDALIRDRFREIDTNHDGRIDADEFIAWQQSMGAAAASACAGSADARELVPETLGPPLGGSDRDRMLAIAIEPLSATVITAANIHYRPGITLADLLAFEDARFNAADTNKDGFLEQNELDAMRHGPAGRRAPRF